MAAEIEEVKEALRKVEGEIADVVLQLKIATGDVVSYLWQDKKMLRNGRICCRPKNYFCSGLLRFQ